MQIDNQGNTSDPSEELHIVLTGTKNNEQFTINSYRLFQNYTNPFNPTTKIGYRLKERGYVKLYVYDIKGELVETLVNKGDRYIFRKPDYFFLFPFDFFLEYNSNERTQHTCFLRYKEDDLS